jgi:uncharacterized membrane protein
LSRPAFLVNVGTDIPDWAARSLVVGRADPAAAGRRVAAASVALAVGAVVLAEAGPGRAGDKMRTKEFLSKLEHDRIIRAIQEAETKTSGEIRVYIQRGNLNGDALAAAQKKFHKLGMHRTGERNGVLIFVAPRAHKFAVVGDKTIHEKCGEQFWLRVVEAMRAHFRNEKFSDALVEAIEEVGKVLAAHFPRKGIAGNELPDQIVEG